MKNTIELNNVSFAWKNGDKQSVLKNLSLNFKQHEFVSIIGPSGCGKSTLLKLIGGLILPDSGNIMIDGKEIIGTNKSVGFVFQDYSLMPWLNLRRNIEFGLSFTKLTKKTKKVKVDEIIRSLGLWEHRNKFPHELSGGMKQRTAIGRAIVCDSNYILLDEPFGALDIKTRYVMQEFLLKVWNDFDKTIIFVTHNIDEAILLSDSILLMDNISNKIKKVNIEINRPRNLYEQALNPIRANLTKHFGL